MTFFEYDGDKGCASVPVLCVARHAQTQSTPAVAQCSLGMGIWFRVYTRTLSPTRDMVDGDTSVLFNES